MTNAEVFNATRDLLAALRERAERWPWDYRRWAQVFDELAADGNEFAKRWTLYNSVQGKSCYELHDGMSMMLSCGLFSWLAPGFDEVILHVSPRIVHERDTACA